MLSFETCRKLKESGLMQLGQENQYCTPECEYVGIQSFHFTDKHLSIPPMERIFESLKVSNLSLTKASNKWYAEAEGKETEGEQVDEVIAELYLKLKQK